MFKASLGYIGPRLRKKAGDVAQWQSPCLAGMRLSGSLFSKHEALGLIVSTTYINE